MRLWLAIPSSIVEEVPGRSERTRRIGEIARAAAIFRAEKVFIFRDPLHSKPREVDFIARIMEYAVTPPYLRRKLFPISEEYEKVGLLHPLGIPPHRRSPDPKPGEIREAVLELVRGRLYADAGLGRLLEYSGKGQAGHRATIVVREREGDYFCEEAEPPEGEYWGYEVSVVDALPKLVKSSRPGALIVTSKHGIGLSEAWRRLSEVASSGSSVMVAFGSRRGLLDMHDRKVYEELGALIVNLIPGQGVETVRTEEAVLAGLAVLKAAGTLTRGPEPALERGQPY